MSSTCAVLLLACLGASLAEQPVYPPPYITVLEQRRVPPTGGAYSSFFRASNGIQVALDGEKEGDDGAVVTGKFSYPQADGSLAELSYVADRHGFKPSSSLLPVGPPMPAHSLLQIQRGIQERLNGKSYDSSSSEEDAPSRSYQRPATTTRRPYTRPATTRRTYTRPTTTRRTYTRPTTTRRPYTRPTTTRRPYTRPTTTRRPYTRPTTTRRPYTRPTTAAPRRTYFRPAPTTTTRPYVRRTTTQAAPRRTYTTNYFYVAPRGDKDSFEIERTTVAAAESTEIEAETEATVVAQTGEDREAVESKEVVTEAVVKQRAQASLETTDAPVKAEMSAAMASMLASHFNVVEPTVQTEAPIASFEKELVVDAVEVQTESAEKLEVDVVASTEAPVSVERVEATADLMNNFFMKTAMSQGTVDVASAEVSSATEAATASVEVAAATEASSLVVEEAKAAAPRTVGRPLPPFTRQSQPAAQSTPGMSLVFRVVPDAESSETGTSGADSYENDNGRSNERFRPAL